MSTPHPVTLADLQLGLRTLLGLPAHAPLPAERAAALPHPLPAHVTLDTGAWIAWCLAGLRLFHGPGLPPLRCALHETRRVIAALGMLRTAGNLSQAAATLATSRKVLRDNLRYTDLYPWPDPHESSPTGEGPSLPMPSLPATADTHPRHDASPQLPDPMTTSTSMTATPSLSPTPVVVDALHRASRADEPHGAVAAREAGGHGGIVSAQLGCTTDLEHPLEPIAGSIPLESTRP